MRCVFRGCRQCGESRSSSFGSPFDDCRLAPPLGRTQRQEAAIRRDERLDPGKPGVDLSERKRLGEESAPEAHGAGLIRLGPFPGHRGYVRGDTTFAEKGLNEIQAVGRNQVVPNREFRAVANDFLRLCNNSATFRPSASDTNS